METSDLILAGCVVVTIAGLVWIYNNFKPSDADADDDDHWINQGW